LSLSEPAGYDAHTDPDHLDIRQLTPRHLHRDHRVEKDVSFLRDGFRLGGVVPVLAP
jgi:hypothetical protein